MFMEHTKYINVMYIVYIIYILIEQTKETINKLLERPNLKCTTHEVTLE